MKDKPAHEPLTDDDLLMAAVELLKELPVAHIRAWDVGVVVALLRDVYNRGIAKGQQ